MDQPDFPGSEGVNKDDLLTLYTFLHHICSACQEGREGDWEWDKDGGARRLSRRWVKAKA
jgi:hypothetical protein